MAETYKQGILHNAHEKSNIPFSYMLYDYSVKEPIRELNLKRALDEDTGVFSSFFSFPFLHLLHWVIIIHTSPNIVNVVTM